MPLFRKYFLIAFVCTGALAGCPNNDARVELSVHLSPNVPVEMLTIYVSDGKHIRALTAADFQTIPPRTYTVPAFDTPTSGTLKTTYTLTAPGTRTVLSTGFIELPLANDRSISISIFVDSISPRKLCMGCEGSKAFPLPAELRRVAADSVFLLWGSNSIKSPKVF